MIAPRTRDRVQRYRDHLELVRTSDSTLAAMLDDLLTDAEEARALAEENKALRRRVSVAEEQIENLWTVLNDRFGPPQDEEPGDNERVTVPGWDDSPAAPF